MPVTPQDILRKYWGYDHFRGQQEIIIQSVLKGQDVLVLMPTGGGKSLCFQLPSLIMKGWVLVISPLISLIQDQELQLKKRGIPVIALHSGLHRSEIRQLMQDAVKSPRGLLYVSPERLASQDFMDFLRELRPSLLAVDEAHCISQWGHDFRPSYLEIGGVREVFTDLPIIALTGTATTRVEQDICKYLNLHTPRIFKTSFARENIDITVFSVEHKWPLLLKLCAMQKGSKIIYVRSRRKSVELADYLRQRGVSSLPYHAGMPAKVRAGHQEAWLKNDVDCIVATSAFGMGVDKADVRAVYHIELPPSIEEYYQEIGRAGRDGERSEAIMLYHSSDRSHLLGQIKDRHLTKEEITEIYVLLIKYLQVPADAKMLEYEPFDLEVFCQHYDLSFWRAKEALSWLADLGYLDINSSLREPSRLQVTANRDELLDMLDPHPKFSAVLKTALRMYEGLYSSPQRVHEPDIANKADMRAEEVVDVLRIMESKGWVAYFGSQEGSGVKILGRREWSKRLVLDYKRYDALHRGRMERAKSMIGLAEASECRQRYILEYFEQEGTEPCGHCDICLGSQRSELEHEIQSKYVNAIEGLTKFQPLSPGEIILAFPLYRKKAILALMNDLLKEGRLVLKDDLLSWNG